MPQKLAVLVGVMFTSILVDLTILNKNIENIVIISIML